MNSQFQRPLSISDIEQWRNETLSEYIKRGRKLAAGLKDADREILNKGFIDKLRDSSLSLSVLTLVHTKGEVSDLIFEGVSDDVSSISHRIQLVNIAALVRRYSHSPQPRLILPSSYSVTSILSSLATNHNLLCYSAQLFESCQLYTNMFWGTNSAPREPKQPPFGALDT